MQTIEASSPSARTAGMIALLLCGLLRPVVAGAQFTAPVAPGAAPMNKWPGVLPPLYRRFYGALSPAGSGVSMIAAVGDLQHSPAPVEQHWQKLSVGEACPTPPAADQFRPFAFFQQMTEEQARALGITFETAISPTDKTAGGSTVVWRVGNIAECATEKGQMVVYGAEWDFALLLNVAAPGPRVSSIADLAKKIPAKDVMAVGSARTNHAESRELVEALQATTSDLQAHRTGPLSRKFISDLEKVRAIGSAEYSSMRPIVPLGVEDR